MIAKAYVQSYSRKHFYGSTESMHVDPLHFPAPASITRSWQTGIRSQWAKVAQLEFPRISQFGNWLSHARPKWVSSIRRSTATSSEEDHPGKKGSVGQARAVPHSHSNHLRCTTCFHPPQEHFLIPSDKPSTPLKENRVCLQLECPNPKYVPQPACVRPGRGRKILHSVSRSTRWDSFHAERPKPDGTLRQLTGEPGTHIRGI